MNVWKCGKRLELPCIPSDSNVPERLEGNPPLGGFLHSKRRCRPNEQATHQRRAERLTGGAGAKTRRNRQFSERGGSFQPLPLLPPRLDIVKL